MNADADDPLPDDLPPLPTDPDPGPTPTTTDPDPAPTVLTIGSEIDTVETIEAAEIEAKNAALAADARYAEMQRNSAAARLSLKDDLSRLEAGAAFSRDRRRVYERDSTQQGYRVITPADPDTPLGVAPPATG